jgi:hypothetical protein
MKQPHSSRHGQSHSWPHTCCLSMFSAVYVSLGISTARWCQLSRRSGRWPLISLQPRSASPPAAPTAASLPAKPFPWLPRKLFSSGILSLRRLCSPLPLLLPSSAQPRLLSVPAEPLRALLQPPHFGKYQFFLIFPFLFKLKQERLIRFC